MKNYTLTKDCYVILPAFNEEKAIGNTIKQIVKYIPKSNIIVIDNSSTDNTYQVCRNYRVRVISESRKGKGFAVRRGFSAVPKSAKCIFLLDADDTYSIKPILVAVNLVTEKHIDMVVGNRVSRINTHRKLPFKRAHKIGNKVISKISNLLTPIGIDDALSGWRVMSPAFVRSFPGVSNGFEIEAELNSHAYLLQTQVINIDVEYQGRYLNSESKIKTFKDGFLILKTNFRHFRDIRPQLAYLLMAMPWALMSFTFTARSISDFIETGFVPKFPSLIFGTATSVITILLLMTGIVLQRVKLLHQYVVNDSFKILKP